MIRRVFCEFFTFSSLREGETELMNRRTGKLLHVYGNVETSRGNLDKAFEFHKRALIQYTLTIGTNHHRTGDLCVKVSDHYIRLQQYDHAM